MEATDEIRIDTRSKGGGSGEEGSGRDDDSGGGAGADEGGDDVAGAPADEDVCNSGRGGGEDGDVAEAMGAVSLATATAGILNPKP